MTTVFFSTPQKWNALSILKRSKTVLSGFIYESKRFLLEENHWPGTPTRNRQSRLAADGPVSRRGVVLAAAMMALSPTVMRPFEQYPVERLVLAGALVLGDPISPRQFDDLQPHQVRKKHALASRFAGLAGVGFPVIDVKATLVDGAYHDVDSSEMAFRSAGMLAIREGVPKGKPVLLEPIVDLEVTTPGEHLSEVIGDLGTRRAQIRNIEGQDDLQIVRAYVPLGQTFSYTTALRSITKGRATFSMEFKHYEPVNDDILKTLVRV